MTEPRKNTTQNIIQKSPKLSATPPALWAHQKKAIEIAGNRFALFFDPGTGKTRTAIELFKKFRVNRDPGLCKALIFAPLNVCRNWQNELGQYLDSVYATFLAAGQVKSQKLRAIKDFMAFDLPGIYAFLIVNIESLRSNDYRELLNKCGATFIVVDESHNFKTPSSLQTKGLLDLVATLKPQRLYLLTGTPAPQGEIDLWSTFRLLGKTDLNFFIWRKRYFHDKNERRRGMHGYWPDYAITESSKALFRQLLDECSLTAKKSEVIDLPPLLRTTIYSEMSAEQAGHYKTMEEYLFAIDSEGQALNAANLLSRTLRLQQILAGFIGNSPIPDNPRLQALDLAIDNTGGEQFLIWTIFAATYQQLSDRLTAMDIKHGRLTGMESAAERNDYMNAFQAGELRALIAHPKAGGVGVNLTAASYSIHYTRNYNLVDDLQCEARNYRGGSERHERITRIDIVTPDTIDEEIVAALKSKKTVQEFILGLQDGRQQQKTA